MLPYCVSFLGMPYKVPQISETEYLTVLRLGVRSEGFGKAMFLSKGSRDKSCLTSSRFAQVLAILGVACLGGASLQSLPHSSQDRLPVSSPVSLCISVSFPSPFSKNANHRIRDHPNSLWHILT